MTDTRRARGSVVEPVCVRWKIETETKNFIDTMARNAGVSSSYMVELLAKSVTLDERGVPEWFTTPANMRGRSIDAA